MARAAVWLLAVVAVLVLGMSVVGSVVVSEVVGHGYKLVDIKELKGGEVGHLELIKATKTLGEDIKRLRLVARYLKLTNYLTMTMTEFA